MAYNIFNRIFATSIIYEYCCVYINRKHTTIFYCCQ